VDPVTGLGSHTGTAQLAIVGTSGDVCVIAQHNGYGGIMLLSYHSADGGQTWPDQERAIVGVGSFPRIVASGAGRDRVVVTCRPAWEFGTPFGPILAAVSHDRGKSFGPGLLVMDQGNSYLTSLAWNDRYQNALVGYGDFKTQVVGGFRPQAITPLGFQGGSTSLRADFNGFDGGADLAWLLLSTDTSSLPLPLGDGRELGIGITPLFLSTLPLAFGGLFATTLTPSGSGSTVQISVASPGVPIGLKLHLVGLSWDANTATFVDISDVVTIDT